MKCKARYLGPDTMWCRTNSIYTVKIYMHKKHIFVEGRNIPVHGYSTMAGLVKDWDFNLERDDEE